MTWTMPPEWAPHARTWMAWPANPEVMAALGAPEASYRAWAGVANAIARFEPVTMICKPGEAGTARGFLDDGVAVIEASLGDAWMRDIGPTFVVDESGALGAVDWTFNGWGGRTFPDCAADALIARRVAAEAGAAHLPSCLVAEGGNLHTDGEGTVLLTESVQLNPNRNPNWTKAEVEAELHARLGTRKAIWLPRGLAGDEGPFGTDGHVDTLAAFLRPGIVAVHGQPDPEHPDHETVREIAAILRAETDAVGRALEVVVLDAPDKREPDGGLIPCSYVNFSFVNGGAVLCGFDDPLDENAMETFRRLFNNREIVQVPALDIFRCGGGVHCITQQQPR